ncbi:Rhodanese- sulfurtransferase, partial [Coemansia sp. RSA 25]
MDVTGILDEHKNRFKSIQVERLVPVEFDLGLMACFDVNMIDEAKLVASQKSRDAYLQEL